MSTVDPTTGERLDVAPQAAELTGEMRRLSELIDDGVDQLRDAASKLAEAEHTYRRQVAAAWAQAPPGTVPEREGWVAGAAADRRRDRDRAEHDRTVALESLRSRRQQLSALQTVARALRSEADAVGYGPDLDP